VLYIFSLTDSVLVSQVLEDVSVISVKITFGEIQMKNAMVSDSSLWGVRHIVKSIEIYSKYDLK
jgi:hypothetical protein